MALRGAVAPLFVVLVSAAALGTALVAQHGFDLLPCLLCIWQRWAYGAALVAGLLALAARGRARRVFLVTAGLAFLAGAGIAGFHVGVEEGWWQGSAECQGTISAGMDREALKNAILNAPTVACDAVPWSLWGISMAGFNVIFSLLFALVTLTLAAKTRRTP